MESIFTLKIFDARDEQPELLEQIAEKVASAYKKAQAVKDFFGVEDDAAKSKLDEAQETELVQIVTRASQSMKPERDEEFLSAVPYISCSWKAMKNVNSSRRLQRVYAMVMLAIHQGKVPMDVETRILCLDDVDDFVRTLDKCGQEWSRRAQTLIQKQHPSLYDELFGEPRIYFSFTD